MICPRAVVPAEFASSFVVDSVDVGPLLNVLVETSSLHFYYLAEGEIRDCPVRVAPASLAAEPAWCALASGESLLRYCAGVALIVTLAFEARQQERHRRPCVRSGTYQGFVRSTRVHLEFMS